ncbi:MAG: AAA family ATPase [Proteobacteria bacterium]|nr:AAA family ATPase [Pseudomonadota bacterium]MBU1687042.1 AAA family ATPase [Pseudomonadota bacterium]
MPLSGDNWVFFGLIASGKSFLATAWAQHHGFSLYNSDRVRKELAGIEPTSRNPSSLNQGIYSSEFSRRTYDELLIRAEAAILQGLPVVLDGSYQSRGERDRVCDLARRLKVQARFILCTCSDDEVKKRLRIRAQDPTAVSDGRWEVLERQKERFEPPDELAPSQLLVLNTERPLVDLLRELDQRFLGL